MSKARKWLALLMTVVMLQIPVVHAEDDVTSPSDIPWDNVADELLDNADELADNFADETAGETVDKPTDEPFDEVTANSDEIASLDEAVDLNEDADLLDEVVEPIVDELQGDDPAAAVAADCAHDNDGHYEYDADGHWLACDDCNEAMEEPWNHVVPCVNSDQCAYCDAPVDSINSYAVSHGSVHFEYDTNGHWYVCDDCSNATEEPWPHYVSCVDLNKCMYCEQPANSINYEVSHGLTHYEHDANTHREVCEDCGNAISAGNHYGAACTDETYICVECGQPYEPSDIWSLEHADSHYEYIDDHYHAYVCDGCGAEYWRNPHYGGLCTDEEPICSECGHAYNTGDIEHLNTHYEHNELYHWTVCNDCGATFWYGWHYADCTGDHHTCTICDGQNVQAEIRHNNFGWDFEYDDVYHWRICDDCGEQIQKDEHTIDPSSPDSGKCYRCGADYTGNNCLHTGNGDFTVIIKEDYHQFVCNVCGEAMPPELHYVGCQSSYDDTCWGCGATITGEPALWHQETVIIQESDGTQHWMRCLECDTKFDVEDHYTDTGDQAGVCSACGAEYSTPETATPTPEATATPAPVEEATATPAPTVEATNTLAPTEEATATPAPTAEVTTTPAPTAKPAVPTATDTTVAATESPWQSFVETYVDNASSATFGVPYEVVQEEGIVTVILGASTVREGNGYTSIFHENACYKLTFYEDASLNDCFNLIGTYRTAAPQGFDAWRQALQEVSELRGDHPYRTFVEFAAALLRTRLPNLSAQETDELLLAILRSQKDDTEIPEALWALVPDDEGLTILGHWQAEGYDFFVMIQNERLMFGMVVGDRF